MSTFNASEEKAIKISSFIETGVSYGTTVTANSDGCGVSFGWEQWNMKGSLQPLLKEFLHQHPEKFNHYFNANASEFGNVLSNSSKTQQLQYAISDINHLITVPKNNETKLVYKVKSEWKTAFDMLGEDLDFQNIERDHARSTMDKAISYAQQYGVQTEKGLVFFYDLTVQGGKGWAAREITFEGKKMSRKEAIEIALQDLKVQLNVQTLSPDQILQVINNVFSSSVLPEYKEMVYSRREAIINGEGKVHGEHLDFINDFGMTNNPLDSSDTYVTDNNQTNHTQIATPVDSNISMPDRTSTYYALDSSQPDGSQLQSHPIDSSQPDGSQLQSHYIESSQPDGSQLQSHPIESSQPGGSQLQSHPIESSQPDGSQLQSHSIDHSSSDHL